MCLCADGVHFNCFVLKVYNLAQNISPVQDMSTKLKVFMLYLPPRRSIIKVKSKVSIYKEVTGGHFYVTQIPF